jgi:hypothetical protein
MVLGSSQIVTPKRISWEISTDRCPYFDNYAKYDSNDNYTNTQYTSQNIDVTFNSEALDNLHNLISNSKQRDLK